MIRRRVANEGVKGRGRRTRTEAMRRMYSSAEREKKKGERCQGSQKESERKEEEERLTRAHESPHISLRVVLVNIPRPSTDVC